MTGLGEIARSYFTDHLPCQRGLQAASVRSYRDAFKLRTRSTVRSTPFRSYNHWILRSGNSGPRVPRLDHDFTHGNYRRG